MKSTIILLCLVVAAVAGAKTTLRYAMKKGDVLRYQTKMNMDMSMSQGGQDISITSSGGGTVHAAVEDATPEAITYTTALEDYKATVSTPQIDTTLSVPELIGKRSRQVSTVRGRELSSVVVDTAHFSNPMMQQFASAAKEMQKVLMELPEQAVGMGDTWVIAKKDTQPGDEGSMIIESKIQCQYVRDADTLGHKCAVVGYALTLNEAGKMKLQKMFDATITGDGSGKGTMFFDGGAGRLVANLFTMELNRQIAVAGQSNMVMPQSMTTTSQIVLLP